MRYGYAIADPRGAEFFTLGQFCKYTVWRQSEPRSGFARQLKEQLLPVGHGDVDRHIIWGEKVADVHGSIRSRFKKELKLRSI